MYANWPVVCFVGFWISSYKLEQYLHVLDLVNTRIYIFSHDWGYNVLYFNNLSKKNIILENFFDIQIINDFANFVRIVFSETECQTA